MTGELPFDLEGNAALVTGCGSESGIGFACAATMARLGARVAITSTTERIHDRGRELEAHGATVSSHVADLTDPDQVAGLVADAERRTGPIDILVAAAGIAAQGSRAPARRMAELTPGEWRRELDVNLMTAILPARLVLPGMAARGHGRIVMISSVTGPVVTGPLMAGYAAAKAGMDGLMRTIALEYGRSGITANCVAPGWIDTASSTPDELVAAHHTPVGRAGTPAEIAALVAFLATRAASFVTGQSIVADGGNTIQEGHGIDLYGGQGSRGGPPAAAG